MIGKSNTYPNYGDIKTAWAPSKIFSKEYEYLEIQFEKKVIPMEIEIYETYTPGSLIKIFMKKKEEYIEIYSGICFLKQGNSEICKNESRIFKPKLKKFNIRTNVFYLIIDITNNTKWYEIDAIKLIGNLKKEKEKIFEFKNYFDIEMIIDDEKFFFHKIILIQNSEYFSNIFNSKKGNNWIDKKERIIIHEDKESFLKIIKFLYSGEINIKGIELTEFLILSEKYKIQKLTDYLIKFLIDEFLNEDNICQIYEVLLQDGFLILSKNYFFDELLKKLKKLELKMFYKNEKFKIYSQLNRNFTNFVNSKILSTDLLKYNLNMM
jgi:hypothetical protein